MSGGSEAQFEALLAFLQKSRGFDFTGYKRPSLVRRVTKRMQAVSIAGFDEYRDHLELHPEEFGHLFNEVLINVTAFFRDPAAWELLGREAIPAVLKAKSSDEAVRVWSAGCASGEEPYSVAILLAEALGEEAFRERVKIYATDVDEHALGEARRATYDAKVMENVSAAQRQKYFVPQDGHYVFRNDLRRALIFGRHDLLQDAPISRLDLLVCRNTLMYFNSETQAGVLQRFHYALGGEPERRAFLFMGKAEMLLSHATLFKPLDLKCRIFERVPAREALPERPSARGGVEMDSRLLLMEQAHEESPVARIVVDANGLLASANKRARLLFSLHSRDVGRPLQDLEISYRPVELRSLIEQAHAERRPVTQSGVERRFAEGAQFFDVVVGPLWDGGSLPLGTSVTFLDGTTQAKLREELRDAREELQTTTEELQSTNEELETTNEELQSSNEELETTNEELQSTNEELETMNEEMQSANEELQSVNEELRVRTEEVSDLNAFLSSVLGGQRGATIAVNRAFEVLLWNATAEEFWGVQPAEARGKSLFALDIGLPMDRLRPAMRACLESDGQRQEELVVDAVNRRGRTFKCRIGCAQLRDARGQASGVILTADDLQTTST